MPQKECGKRSSIPFFRLGHFSVTFSDASVTGSKKNNKHKTHKHFSDGPRGTTVPGTRGTKWRFYCGIKQRKASFVPGTSPILSRGGVPFVPGTAPVCSRHRPAENVYVYWFFLARGLTFFVTFLPDSFCRDSFCPDSFCGWVRYRTIIAWYVAKWGITQMCLCKSKYQGGGLHYFGGVLNPWKGIARYGASQR